MYLLALFGLVAWDGTTIKFSEIPGYTVFDSIMKKGDLNEQTYVAIHEECMPQYIERLFYVAKAMTPRQKSKRKQKAVEKAYVGRVLQDQWGVKFLFLERQATDRLFYRKLDTSREEYRVILFTNMDKIEKYYDSVPMEADTTWEGLMLAIQLDVEQYLLMGGGF